MWEYFKCERCGKCCEETGLPWDPHRSRKIAKFLGVSVSQLIEKYYGTITSDGKHWESEEEKRTPYPLETDFGRCGVDCPAAKKVFEKLEK